MLGGCKFHVRCTDGFTRLMSIMKAQQRRSDCICRVGDLVMVQRLLYATEDKLCILRAKLAPAEVKQVRRENAVPQSWNESGMEGEGGEDVQFDDADAVLQGVLGEEAEKEDEVNLDDL